MINDEDGAEYCVEYIVTRRLPGEDDFTEIGFGSSGAWGSPEQAGYMAETAISRGEWEVPVAVKETQP